MSFLRRWTPWTEAAVADLHSRNDQGTVPPIGRAVASSGHRMRTARSSAAHAADGRHGESGFGLLQQPRRQDAHAVERQGAVRHLPASGWPADRGMGALPPGSSGEVGRLQFEGFRVRLREPSSCLDEMHWQLTGLRISCATPPARKSRASQSFFVLAAPCGFRFLQEQWWAQARPAAPGSSSR